MSQLYTRPEFRRIAGEHWRPGGTEITDRLLVLGRHWYDAGPEGRILDVGCGPGGSVRHLRQQGRQVWGLDTVLRPQWREHRQRPEYCRIWWPMPAPACPCGTACWT